MDAAEAYALAVSDARKEMADEMLDAVSHAMSQTSLDLWTTIAPPQLQLRELQQHPPPPPDMSAEEEWPRLESNAAETLLESDVNKMSIVESGQIVSAWLGNESTMAAVLHDTRRPAPIGGYRLPFSAALPVLRGGICKPNRPRAAVGAWKRLQLDASRAVPSSVRPTSSGAALKSLRGLRSGLAIQERAVIASKLRGATRRQIGKHSRNEAFERARRAAHPAHCGETEHAARRGRHALQDESLADMLQGGLSMRSSSARELCAGGERSDCIEVCSV